MNAIEISYQGKTVRYNTPANWNELSKHQLLAWAKICLSKIDLNSAKKRAVQHVCGLRRGIVQRINLGQILQIADTIGFLGQKNMLNKWVIRSFWRGICKYHGPADALANLTIAEYRMTEVYYQLFVQTGDKKHLLALVATLYRPKRKGVIKDDIRADLTENGVQIREKRFKKLPGHVVEAILLNYEGCRNSIISQYAAVFKPTIRGEAKNKINDLEDIIEALAGDKFGTFSETEQTNLNRFFRHLAHCIARAEEETSKLAS